MPTERDDKEYVDAIPVEPDEGPADAEVAVEADGPPTNGEAEWRPGFRFGLFHKLAVHLSLLILLGGLALTVVMAGRFRQVIYADEFQSAYTVYAAVADELSAHYRSQGGQLRPEQLDEIFRARYLHAGKSVLTRSTRGVHRPGQVVLYGDDGHVLYEYNHDDARVATPALTPDALPTTLQEEYDRREEHVRVAGVVAPADGVVAYLSVTFPSMLGKKLRVLYGETAAVTLIIVFAAGGISLLFVRRELAPLRALSRTAYAVQQGDFSPRVPVARQDEVGELSAIFNDVLSSLSRRMQLMRQMQEAVVKMGRQLETRNLYDTLASVFISLADARTCRLYVAESGTGRIHMRVDSGEITLPLPDEDALSTEAFRERWAQYQTADGRPTSDPAQTIELAIPLLSGTHRNGVIRLGPRPERRPYDQETIDTLHTLAQFASVALENAHLYSQLEEKQRIEQEMMWARNIQESMLPRTIPTLPGYEVYGRSVPANEVGGDYFDYVHGLDSAWHIIIGDVSGKGVPAALIMSIVRSLIHTYLEFESSPGKMLKLVNRSLSADLSSDMFVTLSSIQLDPLRNCARVARAGHEPVMVLRASGEVEEVAPAGAALGLLDVDHFQELIQEEEFVLDHDETLVLYTDGITEAQNREREDFGQDRLREVLRQNAHLSPRELYETILREVRAYATGVPQLDDITVVVLHRNGA